MNLAQLIKEAKQESATAQQCLFNVFCDRMMTVCIRYVKLKEDAEEVLLDGFFKFFQHLPAFEYQGEAALYAWMKKIMINESLMLLRKKNAFHIVTDSVLPDLPLDEVAFDRLCAKEIMEIILQLPVGYRTVFNLHVIEGYEHGEIASMLGIAEGTSKSQLSKAKLLLQHLLNQKGTSYVKRKLS